VAWQEASVPPFEPSHVQLQPVEVVVNPVTLPRLQRSGSELERSVNFWSAASPQEPSTLTQVGLVLLQRDSWAQPAGVQVLVWCIALEEQLPPPQVLLVQAVQVHGGGGGGGEAEEFTVIILDLQLDQAPSLSWTLK
jgi:hypothetical protein